MRAGCDFALSSITLTVVVVMTAPSYPQTATEHPPGATLGEPLYSWLLVLGLVSKSFLPFLLGAVIRDGHTAPFFTDLLTKLDNHVK